MAQVDHSKSDMVSTQEVGVFTVKADKQRSELINPGKAALGGKASLVDLSVEQTFAPAFGRFAVALVFGDVGDHPVIEANLARFMGIESSVSVKKRPGDGQSQALHAFECGLEMGFEVEGVMVISRDNARRSDDVAVGIHDGQDVAGLGTLAALIGHTLTALLGQGMTAVQVQLAQVKVALHGLNARLPHLFQTTIGAPFAKVVVHGLPTDFFFVGSCGSGAIGNCFHWQPVCNRYRM